jgi:hypothetical protein
VPSDPWYGTEREREGLADRSGADQVGLPDRNVGWQRRGRQVAPCRPGLQVEQRIREAIDECAAVGIDLPQMLEHLARGDAGRKAGA